MLQSVVSNGLALGILVLSMVLLFRQKGSYFKPMQPFLITVYAFLCVALVVEVVNDVLQTAETALWFGEVAPAAILLSGLTLATAASAITTSPSLFWRRLGLSVGNTVNRWLLVYTVYTGLLLVLLGVAQPIKLVSAVTLFGRKVLVPRVDIWYGILVLVSLGFFVAYPCRLMILKARRLRSRGASKALAWMAVAWVVSAVLLVGLRGVLRFFELEVGEVANLLAAAAFSVTAYYFRKTDVLQSLFEVSEVKPTGPVYGNVFSNRLGWAGGSLLGKKMLLEYDPSSSFERLVKEFVYESLSMDMVCVVVTRPGSPIHLSLRGEFHGRFLLLSGTVSYPTQGSSDMEVLMPNTDPTIILAALDKALNAQGGSKLSVVVDSLSDLLITWGVKQVYGFMAQCLVMLLGSSSSGVFLFNPSAHEPEVVSALRGLFPIIVALKSDRVSVIKTFEESKTKELT